MTGDLMMVCHESLSGSLCPVMSSRLNSHFRHPSGVLCPLGVGSARRGVAWPVRAVVKTPIRSGATPPCPQGCMARPTQILEAEATGPTS